MDCSYILFVFLDYKLQMLYEENKAKDKKIIKILHDIQNPI